MKIKPERLYNCFAFCLLDGFGNKIPEIPNIIAQIDESIVEIDHLIYDDKE